MNPELSDYGTENFKSNCDIDKVFSEELNNFNNYDNFTNSTFGERNFYTVPSILKRNEFILSTYYNPNNCKEGGACPFYKYNYDNNAGIYYKKNL